jgi:RimJ/RimL family protein N-acetyltransferase
MKPERTPATQVALSSFAGGAASAIRSRTGSISRSSKASSDCVGEVVLNEWDANNRSCNFRTLVGAPGRDWGLDTEAVRMIVGYGFEQLGLHRLSLQVYAFNPRARHVYEKVGFITESVLREELRYRDQWIDAIMMSILAHEWKHPHGRP